MEFSLHRIAKIDHSFPDVFVFFLYIVADLPKEHLKDFAIELWNPRYHLTDL